MCSTHVAIRLLGRDPTALSQSVIPQPSCLDTSVPKSSKPVTLLRRVATYKTYELDKQVSSYYPKKLRKARIEFNIII